MRPIETHLGHMAGPGRRTTYRRDAVPAMEPGNTAPSKRVERRYGPPPHQGRNWMTLSAAAIVFVVLGLTLYAHNRATPGTGQFFDPVLPGMALTFPAVGALVASRRGPRVVVWLLGLGALGAVGFFAEQYAVFALLADPGGLPAAQWAAWLGTWLWAPCYLSAFTLLPILFPDGRASGPWARWLLWTGVAIIGATAVSLALAPVNLRSPAVHNPLGVAGVAALGSVGVATCMFVLGPLALVSLAHRRRRSDEAARVQVRAFAVAATGTVAIPVVALAAEMVGTAVPVGLYQALGLASVFAVGGAVVDAILRHGLYGDDLIASRTALYSVPVYGALGAVLAPTYAGLMFLFAALVPSAGVLGSAALAIGVAALVGRALQPRIRAGLDRVLYRRRDYDYGVLAQLGERLRSTLGPDAMLPVIAETVASALKLPFVHIAVGRGEVAASATFGTQRPGSLVLALVHHGENVGRLTVASRGPDKPFDEIDRRLLDELAAQAAIVAYALCLATDLQRSRERLVAAREEERRRLRRDLHDGLKPTLAGVALGLDAVRNIVGRDPEAAGSLLVRLRSELEGAGGDIRRLVHDLRPPALDELGLVGALGQHASRFQRSPGTPEVSLDAPELPALPAAVEVAAYRIVLEALENVRTHAHAHSCVISLRLAGGELQVEVCDDGTGLEPGSRSGVGLLAMQERAAELGGSCSIERAPGGGTWVRARLPLELP